MKSHEEVYKSLVARYLSEQMNTNKTSHRRVAHAVIIVCCIIILSGILVLVLPVIRKDKKAASGTERIEPRPLRGTTEKQVYFSVSSNAREIDDLMRSELEDISGILASVLNVHSGKLSFGRPITVYGCEGYYYIPVFVQEECRLMISYLETESEKGAISFFDNGCKELNALESGLYCFRSCSDGIYLIGENTSFRIEKNCYPSAMDYMKPEGALSDNMIPFSGIAFEKNMEEGALRGVVSKELTTVPYVSNSTGNKCWLSIAVSVAQYYGSSVTCASGHGYAHPNHSYPACPSGTLDDSKNVILGATSFTSGTVTTSQCNAAKAMYEINLNKPICSAWGPVSSLTAPGYAMVICGYVFDNSSGAFTYIFMDPDRSSRRYASSTYSASPAVVSLVVGGTAVAYKWEGAIYGLQ